MEGMSFLRKMVLEAPEEVGLVRMGVDGLGE